MTLIKEIESENSKLCYEFDSTTIKLWSQNQWQKELENDFVTTIGIYLNNKLLGLCVFQKIYDEAEIRYLSIHPSHKRKGLGKKLIYIFMKQCKSENIKRIFLEVSLKNKQALRFYEYFGFKTISIRKKYYKDGSDALLKEKKC